jgi:hypothetical protein
MDLAGATPPGPCNADGAEAVSAVVAADDRGIEASSEMAT